MADTIVVLEDTVTNVVSIGEQGPPGTISSVRWGTVTEKPTTIAGFGITDAAPLSHVSDFTLHLTSSQNVWLDAITASAVEVNYLSNVTSNIQTQLNSKQGLSGDLTAIAGLADTSGFLKKTAANVWALDTNTYITGNQSITITGDAAGSGTTSIALTLANIANSSTGSFYKVSVNGKGLVSGTAPVTQSDITGLLGAGSITNTMLANTAVALLSGTNTGDETASSIKTKLGISVLSGSNTGDQTITLTGDVTGSGTGSFATTLTNSGITAGTYNNNATSVTPLVVDAKGRVTAVGPVVTITPAWASITSKPTTLSGYGIVDSVNTSSLGVAYGVATLDSAGKLATSQIPAALVGALQYQGTWNASTNTPTLLSGVGTKGQYYKVATAGTSLIDGITQWNVGDMLVFNGTTWDKIDGLASEVVSVAGRVGAVTLSSSDISGLATSATTDTTNAANISSGTLAATRLPAFTGDATSSAGSSALTLADSGVTAGTYKSVTVDAKGRVTTGTNPTTVAGYGLTDVYTKAEVDALLAAITAVILTKE